jgi:predicted nucleic acid-binding protein
MPGHLLDTDSCIFYMKGHRGIRNRVEKAGGLSQMHVSTLTVAELWDGVYRFKNVQDDTAKTVEFLNKVKLVRFDEIAAQRFGALRSQIAKMEPKHNIDLMNASVALTRKMVVVTNNTKHYQGIHGLKVENWVAALYLFRSRRIRGKFSEIEEQTPLSQAWRFTETCQFCNFLSDF